MSTELGRKIIEGKTKIVTELATDISKVVLTAKDDITAFNKQKHDLIEGKSRIATNTTCNVFRFLKKCGLPVAFDEQIDESRFIAPYCDMILYEVVVRREAHGSFLKRHPYLKKGHVFPEAMLEFFLKTTDLTWKNTKLAVDDPYITISDHKGYLYRPDKPLWEQEPLLVLEDYPLAGKESIIEHIGVLARKAFFALEKAWQMASSTLVDFKLEFGLDRQGNLLIADVIDNDSWRVVHDNAYLDKQFYRDGGALNEVRARYEYVQQMTAQFSVPRQQIIIWRGSDKDDIEDVISEINLVAGDALTTTVVTRSMHKDPVGGYLELTNHVQKIPDTIILALIGKSNGAGPTLSASTCVPVITVPVGWEKFPDDIWSSLRTPSKVPVMTVLDKKNACLAALQILAQRNARLYMSLQAEKIGSGRNIVRL
jgi:phosphoribosylaminoimidazole carboxylase / phosphoribosylaminoimidazole-succinocarboxamide synthase